MTVELLTDLKTQILKCFNMNMKGVFLFEYEIRIMKSIAEALSGV